MLIDTKRLTQKQNRGEISERDRAEATGVTGELLKFSQEGVSDLKFD